MIQEKLDKKRTEIISIFIFAMIFLSAIGANAPGVEVGGLGKLYLFRLMVPILLLFFFNRNFYNNSILPDTIILFVVWMLCATISLIWSFDLNNSISGIFNYLICFIWIIWLLGVIKTKKMFQNVIIFITVLILCCCALGIFESYTGKYYFNVQEGVDIYLTSAKQHYPVVFFFNPNDFMFFIIGIIPFLFCVIRDKVKNVKLRYIMYITYLGLSCFMLWLADCRMGFVVLPFMLLVFFLTKNVKKRLPAVAVLLIVTLSVVLAKRPSLIQEFMQESRLDIWKDAVNNFVQSNFLGTGVGNANFHLDNVEYLSEISATHFWFLQIFVELGIVFMVIFMIWLYTIFKRGIKMIRNKDKKYNTTGRATIVFITALIPMSMMSSSLALSPIFWTYISLLLLAVSIKEDNEEVSYEQGNIALDRIQR